MAGPFDLTRSSAESLGKMIQPFPEMEAPLEEFYALEKQFQALKQRAEETKIKVILVYKLVPYEYHGAQGTHFVTVGRMWYFPDYHDAFKTQLDCINENLAKFDKNPSKEIYLLTERLYSAAGSYYYPDGSIVNLYDEPTEGYLRVRTKNSPANNVWIYVDNVEGGIESTPANASSKLPKPEGWDGYKDRRDIMVEWESKQ